MHEENCVNPQLIESNPFEGAGSFPRTLSFESDSATHHHVNLFIRGSQSGDGIRRRETLRIPRIMEYGPSEFQATREVYPPVSIQVIVAGGVSNGYQNKPD